MTKLKTQRENLLGMNAKWMFTSVQNQIQSIVHCTTIVFVTIFTSTFLPALPPSLFFKTNLCKGVSGKWNKSRTQNGVGYWMRRKIDGKGFWVNGVWMEKFENLSNKAYPRKITTTTKAAITPRVTFACDKKVSTFHFTSILFYRIVFVVGHFLPLHLPNKLRVMSKWAEWGWKSLIPAANNRSCVTAWPPHCPSCALSR